MRADETMETTGATVPGVPPGADPRGALEWQALAEPLLAGLVHALNNRVTALSVCAELAALGDAQMLTDGVLSSETMRLQQASALIALLPARERPAEALELRPVLDDALAMHAHHPRLRMIECVVETVETLQPVRAPRWALLRVLLVLVDAAKSAADASGAASMRVRLAGDDDEVRICVHTPRDGGVYGAQLAAFCGGRLVHEGESLMLALPSLLAVRRRERLARAAE